ncbi:MAG TPA: hypothetical protein VNY05_45440 [Candidatus Acidoferrales bacterium]|nr:hypothetical protein [Candidatus Acidoferrales bacterium]
MPNQPRTEHDVFYEALKPGGDCLPESDLETLLGEFAPEDLVRHIENCPHCRTELNMLRSFHSNEIPAGDTAAVRAIAERLHANSAEIFGRTVAPPWWKRLFTTPWFTKAWLGPAAWTAAALLVVAGAAIQWRHTGAPSLNPVTDAGREVLRSSTIAVLAPAGDLREAPLEVRWESAPAATRYQVRLLEVDHTELWKAEVSDTHTAIPPEVRARIVPAKTLLCEVSAFDSAGRKVAQSEAVRFRFSQNVYPH